MIAVTVAMASVLLWAGLEKARRLGSFAGTLQQLGIPSRRARVAAPCLVGIELGVALGLIFRPDSPATLAGVLGLATAFAVAGLVAQWRNETILCGCFGPSSGGRLGKRQLVALPVWVIGATLLWLNLPPLLSTSALPALVPLTMATVRGVGALREAHAARGDRRSAQEMFKWLTR